MDFATRKQLYNACDPREPLDPRDPRNVDVDKLDRDHAVRGEAWVDHLTPRSSTVASAWLADLAVHKRLAVDNDEQRRAADRMLSANAVMRYLNQESWWDIHPAVRELPEIAAEIARLEGAKTLDG